MRAESQLTELPGLPVELRDGVPPPRLVPYSRSWYIAKLILRVVSILLCFIIFAFAIASNAGLNKGAYDWSWVCAVPPTLLVAGYDIAGFVVVCVRRSKKRGIHPAVDVAADLVLWVACMVGGALLPYTSVTMSVLRRMAGLDIGMMVFVYILMFLHFLLFCRACHETRQRNQSRGFESFVYIPGGGQPFPILFQSTNVRAAREPAPFPGHVPNSEEMDLHATSKVEDEMDLSYSVGSVQKEVIPDEFYPRHS